MIRATRTLAVGGAVVLTGAALFAASRTDVAPMMSPDTDATSQGWKAIPVFTVSETIDGYQPTGILDGIGAVPLNDGYVRVLVNSELSEGNGYAYSLANGTQLTGARVSYFDVQRTTLKVKDAGLAYDTIYDRQGNVVTDPAQVNEDGNAIDGFARFCSGRSVFAGQYNFDDAIFFAGEESSKPFHPHGGTEWALDIASGDIWAVPAMGRAAWENVTPIAIDDPDKVAILGGDDVQAAPLYLFIGQKNSGSGNFLDRNGLENGTLYCWAADNGDLDPQSFNGNGASRAGSWVQLDVQDPSMAGRDGYDAFGYLDGDTLRTAADALGCFSFSRPEDLHENPANPTQVAFASTGRGGLYPADNWGTLYVVDVDLDTMTADVTILFDGDDTPVPDAGLRSPDNLVWAYDGYIYVQEDRSTSPSSLFGADTGIDASLWQVDPATGDLVRIAEVDDDVVAPEDATNICAGVLGCWETSGVLDVTDLFETAEGETLLILDVQAHGIRDGAIGDNPLLDEGGQLLFLSSKGDRKQGGVDRQGRGNAQSGDLKF
jgi:hypothetical protein